jgi:hypothetical protein
MTPPISRSTTYSCVTLTCIAISACRPSYNNNLPSAQSLGSPRNYQIARSLNHMHSPYSWDACDKKGLVNGQPDPICLQHLKDAFCTNRFDFVFMTDHPDNMTNFEMTDLLLKGPKDTIVTKNGLPYVNRMGSCTNGFVPSLLVGFESTIMAMGMTQQIDPSPSVRSSVYQTVNLTNRNLIATQTGALIVIPHTEGPTLDWITGLQPDAIEIYNFHANIDPKIRKTYLGFPPFQEIPGFLSYLVDPYGDMVPDFAFLNFLQISSVYAQKWDSLIYSGLNVVGLGGTDSHENVFPQKVADGERLDGHRRISRMMSNHFLVKNLDPDELKASIKAGRGWVVFEGFGSPYQMDYYANLATTGSVVGVGETGSLGGGSATIVVQTPTLFSQSPHGDEKPIIRTRLKQVIAGGTDQVVASSENAPLSFTATTPGAYRAEISIVPRHLRVYLSDFPNSVDQEFMWVITNHLYLTN